MSGQNSSNVAAFIENWEIVLRRRQQGIDGFLQRRRCRECAKLAHHRARNRKSPRDIAHLGESCFLRRADVNEKRDENQKWIRMKQSWNAEQADNSKEKRESLTDGCCDLSCPGITHSDRKQSAQYPTPIHWKGGNQIEQQQVNID